MKRPKFIYYNERSYQEYGESLEEYINYLEEDLAICKASLESVEDDLYDANLTIDELRDEISELKLDLKEANKNS